MQHCSSQLGKLNRSSKKSSKLMLLPTVNPDAANLKGLAVAPLRSRIRVLRAIGEILLDETGALGVRLGDVNALYFEHHGALAVLALEQILLPHREARARPARRIRQIALLQLREALGLEHRHLALMFHGRFLLQDTLWSRPTCTPARAIVARGHRRLTAQAALAPQPPVLSPQGSSAALPASPRHPA